MSYITVNVRSSIINIINIDITSIDSHCSNHEEAWLPALPYMHVPGALEV